MVEVQQQRKVDEKIQLSPDTRVISHWQLPAGLSRPSPPNRQGGKVQRRRSGSKEEGLREGEQRHRRRGPSSPRISPLGLRVVTRFNLTRFLDQMKALNRDLPAIRVKQTREFRNPQPEAPSK